MRDMKQKGNITRQQCKSAQLIDYDSFDFQVSTMMVPRRQDECDQINSQSTKRPICHKFNELRHAYTIIKNNAEVVTQQISLSFVEQDENLIGQILNQTTIVTIEDDSETYLYFVSCRLFYLRSDCNGCKILQLLLLPL